MNRSRSWRARGLAAAGVSAALLLAACGGGGPGGEQGPTTQAGASGFNAGSTSVVNPSEAKGGTLKFANEGDWDTLDTGETYYAYSWNFARLYGRSLMMFKSAPGKEGNQLVPDLAEGPGEASGDAKTWTYKLRQGVKFDDGTEVTSADVKYAILRSTDKQTFPNGPAYWEGVLDLPSGYKGPYKTPNMNTDSAIETPDKYTIVFHAKAPFAAFDYLAQQPNTMPVPKDKDTGAKYRNTIVSTGPYKFEDLQPGKSFNLVRNDQWDPATDPNRKALPDRIEVTLNVNPDDIDNRLISGDLDVDSSRPLESNLPRRAGSCRIRPSRRTRTTRLPCASGTPRSTRPCLRSTTSNAARRSCTPWTAPATRLHTVASLRVGIWQRQSCRRTFRAIRLSICTRTVKITRVTSRRRRSHWKPAASRTVLRPTSPTAQSGLRRRRLPRRSSRRCLASGSSSR